MRFVWDEQQELLRSTVQRFVADRHDFDTRRNRVAAGSPPETWQDLADLGLLGVPFSEDEGGIGGGPLDTLLVMEAFGRGLVLEPYVPTVVLGGGIVRRGGSDGQKSRLIAEIVAGETRLALAFAETEARYNLANVRTTARAEGNGYLINGAKSVVLGAPHAHACFVTARTHGEQCDRDGISVFLVPLDGDGVTLRSYLCMDGLPAAEIGFADVRVPGDALFGTPGGGLPLVERVIDEATVAICAEAVGAMAAVNEKCLEFAMTRSAFGQPIVNFQAVQHRLVDMRVSAELAAGITLKAASHLAEGAADAARTVAACKVQVNQEAAFVGKNAVQVHGAVGMTEELDIGHYFRRLTAIQSTFGSADHHLGRYVDLAHAGRAQGAQFDGH